ncbi:F-box family protein [Rhynchospora pubera]|uniref:F-box family protein n=1 Tax=Rhynchospora pubera TaxID=906938 RepID=A0AAV8HNN2_9POAL|nr:F-box family protein [Rhynchospora pubera]
MAGTTGLPPPITVDPPPPQDVLIDWLSDLPDLLLLKILSFLPTHLAAQTSCLSRRFRHLWSSSPSLYFDCCSLRDDTAWFINMVDQALRCRDSSATLESFCLKTSYNSERCLPLYPVLGWIDRINELGVRHIDLTMDTGTAYQLFWDIFSIKSLESLHIKTFDLENYSHGFETVIACTRLKSLYLWFNMDSPDLTQLISGLPVLEYLELWAVEQDTVDISSPSVKTLKMECRCCKLIKLDFPKLETLRLVSHPCKLEMFQGDMPLVSKVEFRLSYFHNNMPLLVLERMLKTAANAKELKLSIQTYNGTCVETYLKCEMQLCFPRLECLQFSCNMCNLHLFQWEMPALRKANICLSFDKRFVPAVSSFLKHIANVVDLNFTIETYVHFENTYLRCSEMQLSFPRLEYLEFSCRMCFLELFQAEMPVLRKADIHLSNAKEEFVPPVSGFLKLLANVVDLKLIVKDDMDQLTPFNILVPYESLPLFPCLNNFELSTPCHEATIKDVINLLENAPVLNCLKMHHRDPCIARNKDKKKMYWRSKLPRNSEGNFQHSCFTDLHNRDEKSHAIKLLSRRLTSKKRKI